MEAGWTRSPRTSQCYGSSDSFSEIGALLPDRQPLLPAVVHPQGWDRSDILTLSLPVVSTH